MTRRILETPLFYTLTALLGVLLMALVVCAPAFAVDEPKDTAASKGVTPDPQLKAVLDERSV